MRAALWMAVGLLAAGALGCSAKKLEAPDAGQPEKKKTEKKVDPYAELSFRELGRHDKGATHVAWSPDGKLLLSTGRDHKIYLWDPASGERVRTLEGHSDTVAMAVFSKDGAKIASAADDRTARIWEAASGKQLALLEEKAPKGKLSEEEQAALDALPPPKVNWALFTADGAKLLTASDDFALKLWDADSGKLLDKYVDEGCRQRSVHRRREADGWVSSAGCVADGVAYLKFWDAAGHVTGVRGDERHDAHFIAFDRQARFLAAADGSTFVNIFSAQGSFLKQIMVGSYHFCLEFGPADATLLVGTDGGQVLVYRVDGWRRLGQVDVGQAVAIDGLALNPNTGSLAAALRDGRVMLLDEPIRPPAAD